MDSKLSKCDLDNLGEDLKRKLFKQYKTIYIHYYLKDVERRTCAWAITNFEKTRKTVRINGLEKEAEEYFREVIKRDQRDVIGHWIVETVFPALITLYKEEDIIYSEKIFSDKSEDLREQITRIVSEGTKYRNKEKSNNSYMIVDKDGKLSLYDNFECYEQIESIKV